MKKIISAFILFCLFSTCYAAESAGGYARSAIVIDASSGKVLYEKNAYEKLGMASTTKIMTAICGVEYGDLNGVVKVSGKAAGIEGSSMYLKAGEKLYLKDIITGLMLVSGNDAATAVAESVSGSEGGFVLLMNQKAHEIGAYNTCFQNPHGLSHPEHYTTAYDLAKITAYALKNPAFSEIVGLKSAVVENLDGDKRSLSNHNKLLRLYNGCIGVKTGFTKATGRCLVSAAERDGLKLICVTLNDGNDWNDHTSMLDRGFSEYESRTLVKKDTSLAKAKVIGGEKNKVMLTCANDEKTAVKKGENVKLSLSMEDIIKIEAPVEKGKVYAKADIMENGEKIGEIDLIAAESVNRAQKKEKNSFFKKLFGK